MEFEHVKPMDIEKRSMEIIGQELAEKGITLPADKAHIIKRVIHTTADFEYADTLTFSEQAKEALRAGATIVTDTKMAWSGINKRTLENLHGKACNFISDEDVAEAARQHGFTRSAASMDKAASLPGPLIFAIGNAPTALIRLYDRRRKTCTGTDHRCPSRFCQCGAGKGTDHGNRCALYHRKRQKRRKQRGGSNLQRIII